MGKLPVKQRVALSPAPQAREIAGDAPADEHQAGVSSPGMAAGATGDIAPAARGRHEVSKVAVAEIMVGDPIRPPSEERIARLATSVKAVGLRSPIIVRPAGRDRKLQLVAGYARLEAVKRLGWETVAAILFRGNEIEAKIEEIDDNFQNELVVLEKGILLLRRKELYERLHPEVCHGGDRKSEKISSRQSGDLKLRFTEATSKRLGVPERSIQRAISRAERISVAARKQLLGTPLANVGADLDALTFLTVEEQLAAIEDALSMGCSVRAAIKRMNAAARDEVAEPGNVINMELERLKRKWKKLTSQNKVKFLDWLVNHGEAKRASSPGEATFTIRIEKLQNQTSRENDVLGIGG